MKRKTITLWVAVLAFLLALGITLYPLISTWYNDRHQAQIHVQYQQQVEQADTSAIQKARELAIAYNDSIKPGIQLTDAFSQDSLLWASEDYGDLLNLTGNGIMGYIRIPSIRVSLPILHGTKDATLEQGVGHLLGSSLPVGGESTHSVLTAHSGMANAKMFSDLDLLQIGDLFFVDVLGDTLAYRVDQIKVVLPHDTTYLGITEGADQATLITCTPFGVNTHRLLVRGSRTDYKEAEATQETQPETEELPESTWEQEYLKGIYIAIGIVVSIAVIWLILWLFQREKHEHVA